MDRQLFRKSSIDRVSSPEQLNDYIRVTNPGVWLVLVAVIVLLVGVCIWGIFGRLETKVTASVKVEEGEACLFLPEGQTEQVQPGMKVTVQDKEYELGNLLPGGQVQSYAIAADLPDGVYQAEILVERISPMSFVFN